MLFRKINCCFLGIVVRELTGKKKFSGMLYVFDMKYVNFVCKLGCP